MPDPAALVADTLRSNGARTLVLTGAGISLASGIPTFRGGDTGALWATQAMERATLRHFEREPADTWTWYRERLGTALGAAPNAAHRALTALEAWSAGRGHALRLVTQNIDPLHERAGARALIKVHGSIDRARCANPGCHVGATGTTALADLDFSGFDRTPDAATIPRCGACGSLMRPHVLWFDERYGSHPAYEWPAVLEACETMTLAIAVGTSFSVGVTDLVATAAAQRRVPLVIVDPAAPSIPTGPLAIHVREKAEVFLPAVCARLEGPAPTAIADPILQFYRLESTDARGRTLTEILAWDDERLESVHDYIQWLFPLPEPSSFNPIAPILGDSTVAAFQHDAVLQARLAESLARMLAFYGLTQRAPASGRMEIETAKDFRVKSRVWLHAGNHNHLRLTRILASLRLLGLGDQSRALFLCLDQIAGGHPHAISATTLGYWRRAAG